MHCKQLPPQACTKEIACDACAREIKHGMWIYALEVTNHDGVEKTLGRYCSDACRMQAERNVPNKD